jgi:type IV secretion system protein VirD4
LCLYKGSVICLDPKGENAMITAERRGQGNSFCKGLEQKIFVIDPFGITKGLPDEMRTSFNPLSLLYADSDSVVEDAALIAEALVVSTDDKAAHWDESACFQNRTRWSNALFVLARSTDGNAWAMVEADYRSIVREDVHG